MSENMPAIVASFVKLNTLADGRLRILLETDHTLPEVAALGLIPGATFGLVRMTQEATKEQAQKETVKRAEEEKPKGGPLAKLAGMWCNDKDFHHFMLLAYDMEVEDANHCGMLVREFCNVGSRANLDWDPNGAERFEEILRQPYMEWRKERGLN